MVNVYVDPSFTGTGVFACGGRIEDSVDTFYFNLIHEKSVKKTLDLYYKACVSLRNKFRDVIADIKNVYKDGEYTCFIEAPVVGSQFSSSGLYALQFFYLDILMGDEGCKEIRTIPPSWISPNMARHYHVFKTSEKKELIKKILKEEYPEVRMFNFHMLKKAGADIQTAFLFYHMAKELGKAWKVILKGDFKSG